MIHGQGILTELNETILKKERPTKGNLLLRQYVLVFILDVLGIIGQPVGVLCATEGNQWLISQSQTDLKPQLSHCAMILKIAINKRLHPMKCVVHTVVNWVVGYAPLFLQMGRNTKFHISMLSSVSSVGRVNI